MFFTLTLTLFPNTNTWCMFVLPFTLAHTQLFSMLQFVRILLLLVREQDIEYILNHLRWRINLASHRCRFSNSDADISHSFLP